MATIFSTIRPPQQPRLPAAPVEYAQRYGDDLTNILRLYFNQLDSIFSSLVNAGGGKFLSFPYVAASDTTTQYATATDTPTVVKWNTLGASNLFTLNVDSTATAGATGLFKITYSLQLANNHNSAQNVVVWLRVNGVDVVGSSTIFTLPARKSAGVPAYVCAYSEVVFSLTKDDVVGLYWGTDQAATSGGTTGTYIYAQAAQTTPMAYPSTPSAIGSITFVSGPLT